MTNDRREFQILIKGRKFGSAFRYNYIEGQSKILVALDASTIPLDQGDITCPDFEEPTGLVKQYVRTDTLKMITSNGDDIDEEFEEGDAFDDTQICFLKSGPPENSWYSWEYLVSLGPCKHMRCIVWNLKPIQSNVGSLSPPPLDTP